MKERPILFSDAMVRAILEGRKTVTRRLIRRTKSGSLVPYCDVGDLLYVREAFARADDGFVYRATDPGRTGPWLPSIFMPKEASRIDLRVTAVRRERLQLIEPEDVVREGIEVDDLTEATSRFRALWDEINGERAPWASNPDVWRVEFRLESVRV